MSYLTHSTILDSSATPATLASVFKQSNIDYKSIEEAEVPCSIKLWNQARLVLPTFRFNWSNEVYYHGKYSLIKISFETGVDLITHKKQKLLVQKNQSEGIFEWVTVESFIPSLLEGEVILIRTKNSPLKITSITEEEPDHVYGFLSIADGFLVQNDIIIK